MVKEYILLASGCVAVGVVIVFVVLAACQRFGINIEKNLWVLAIPAVLAIILNIILLEVYHRFRKRKK
jgi:hypothetical protein